MEGLELGGYGRKVSGVEFWLESLVRVTGLRSWCARFKVESFGCGLGMVWGWGFGVGKR